MIKMIQFTDTSVEFDLPDICPHCGLGIVPNFLGYAHSYERPYVGVIFGCPSCKKISFASYELSVKNSSAWTADLNNDGNPIISSRIGIYPQRIYSPKIPDEIKNYYQEFFEIYTQAHIAEQNNLHQITGMAYRKALENLVKNYLIEKFPSLQSEILNEPLGKSISRIEYPNIQSLARAASWIGNDETHIVKKNSDWKVSDMKGFILALCHLILAEKVSFSAFNMVTSNGS